MKSHKDGVTFFEKNEVRVHPYVIPPPLIMATLYDVAHYASWNGYTEDMKGYLGIDKASWTNKEFWFPYGANALYGSEKKTRLQCICENIYDHRGISRIKELLNNGAKPDIKDLGGTSPLSACARDGLKIHVEIMKILLDSGADINQKNKKGESPIFRATRNNNIDIIKFLLDSGADINAKTNRGLTPLSTAAFNNYIDMIKVLVKRGADINTSDTSRGWSPLDNAIYKGNITIVKYLCENGATITENSFSIAIEEGYANVLKYFKKLGLNAPANSIYSLVKNNNPKLINLLLKMGGDLNYIDDSGETPLSIAMFNKSYECMEALCNLGANMTMIDIRTNFPPIQTAIIRGDHKSVKILLNNGVDVNTTINDMPLLYYGILMMDLYRGNDEDIMCVKEIINSAPDFNNYHEHSAEFAKRHGFEDIAIDIRRAELKTRNV
jgi:ankyrin repeat protein